jgi:tellurite resistance protein
MILQKMMKISESAGRLRKMIEKAIEDEKITRAEMDAILHIATEDGHIDPHERALLNQLQEMIEDKSVKLVL